MESRCVLPHSTTIRTKPDVVLLQNEENELLQTRAANAVAKLIENCLDPVFGLPVRPALKLIENLPKFICSDETFTPQFGSLEKAEGILTLVQAEASKLNPENVVRNLVQESQALTRRGALAALSAVVNRLGDTVFERAPNFWNAMATPIGAQTDCGKQSEPFTWSHLVFILTLYCCRCESRRRQATAYRWLDNATSGIAATSSQLASIYRIPHPRRDSLCSELVCGYPERRWKSTVHHLRQHASAGYGIGT
jgi:hypothetical protein